MISALTCFSFARSRLASVFRRIQKRPPREVAQMCVNPRKLNVSGFPSPRAARSRAACGPNSISLVFSGCRSRLNFANRSRSPSRNASASSRYWNPTMKSSAYAESRVMPIPDP
jgi:hypothetical protein